MIEQLTQFEYSSIELGKARSLLSIITEEYTDPSHNDNFVNLMYILSDMLLRIDNELKENIKGAHKAYRDSKAVTA